MRPFVGRRIMAKQFWMAMLFMALGVAGSASAWVFGGGAATDADLEGIQHMAVVSLLGDTFYGVSIGLSASQNMHFDAVVPQWDMNARVTGEVVRVMASSGRVSAQALKLGDPSVAAVYRKASDDQAWRDGLKTLLGLAQEQGSDALLVIQRTDLQNSSFLPAGFGLIRRSIFWHHQPMRVLERTCHAVPG